MEDQESIRRRAASVKLLLMDCDGVLTDGRIWILQDGDDQKAFNTKDGLGLELLHRAGLRSGIISGRHSSAVRRRAVALRVSYLLQGCESKIKAFEEILTEAGLDESEVAFMGDDLNDVPLLRRAALAIAVADAAEEVKSCAHLVTGASGGKGAVREVVEVILRSQGRWDNVIKVYLES